MPNARLVLGMTRIHEPYFDLKVPLCRTQGDNIEPERWSHYRIRKYEVTPVTCEQCLRIRAMIEETRAALVLNNWKIQVTADYLKLNRVNLHGRMKKFRIKRPPEIKRHSFHGTLTHCRRGHLFDWANTYRTKEGYRKCRECDRSGKMVSYRRKINGETVNAE